MKTKVRVIRRKARKLLPPLEHELHHTATEHLRFYVWEFIILVVLQIDPSEVVRHASIVVRRIFP